MIVLVGGRMEENSKRTHRSDPASGRGSRNGAAGLPQSASEHCEMKFREKKEGEGGVVSLRKRDGEEVERREEREERGRRVVDGWKDGKRESDTSERA